MTAKLKSELSSNGGSLHDVVLRLREQVKGAERILGLYDSPFPDAIERYNRSTQLRYVEKLKRELKRVEEEAQNSQ